MNELLSLSVTTNEQLRNLLNYINDNMTVENRSHIPTEMIWGILPEGAKDGPVPTELGGGSMLMSEKYYIQTIDNQDFMLIGRNEINTFEHPTGSYQVLTPEQFWNAVDLIGIDNLYIELPEPIE